MNTDSTDDGERRRLDTLRDYEILDSLPEAVFDNITLLASQICQTPIALISLIDRDRQWFKSRRGIDVSETTRDQALCSTAIKSDARLFEVEDCTRDPAFADNPLVRGDPGIVFYAGAPLEAPDGSRLGTLCVIDRRPRVLTDDQRVALKALAQQVLALIETRKLHRSLVAQRRSEAKIKRRAETDRRNLKSIFDSCLVGMALVREPDFVFEQVNETFQRLVGPREYLTKKWSDVYLQNVGLPLLEILMDVYKSGTRHVAREMPLKVENAAGVTEDRLFDVTCDRVDGDTADVFGVLIQTLDVTDEVHNRRALIQSRNVAAESRNTLFETLRALPIGVAFLDGPDHRFTFVNEAHNRYFGGRDDFVGKPFREAVPELAKSSIPTLLDEVFETGTPFFSDDFLIPVPQVDGGSRTFIYKLAFQPSRDVSGVISGIVVTVVDLTDYFQVRRDLVRKNQQLEEARRLLDTAAKVAKIGFFEWDFETGQVQISPQMRSDWGLDDRLPLEHVMDRIIPEDRPAVQKSLDASIERQAPFAAEYRVRRPHDRDVRWIEAQGEVSRDSAGRPRAFIGTTIDVTARRELEREARDIANSIPQMAWTADATGRRTWFNERWYAFTGRPFADVRDFGWRTLVHPDHVERVLYGYRRAWAKREPWEDVFQLRGADGGYRWFLTRAAPIFDENGHVSKWFGTNTDVTRQKENEASLTRLAAVVESSRDFIGLADREFRPFFLNRGGRAMVGFDDRDVAAATIPEFFMPDQIARVETEVIPALMDQGAWQGELDFRNFNTGQAIPVYYDIFAVRDPVTNAGVGYATVTRDISERRIFEKQLEDSKDQAEKANSAKSAFLANMSHEIRSPLGAILGFADLIDDPNVGPAETANFASVIRRNSHHVLRIIDDILDLSKVEAGKMLVEHIEFSLPDLLADFASLMGLRARNKKIEFELILTTAVPERITSDPTRVRQILNNAVGNAIKFTDQGRVSLRVHYRAQRLRFEITDTGLGLSAAQSEKLFRAFEQADDSTTRKFGGTGLGLVLTRKLAELMGGSFDLARSVPGEGSTFVAEIGVKADDRGTLVQTTGTMTAPASRPTSTDPRPLEKLQILVIDDSPDNRDLFELMLKRLGAVVEVGRDGVEGVDLAQARSFDAILCDVQMPRMDGYETLHNLRRRGLKVPIIALTAHAMKEERDRALAAGFTDFLSKPVDKAALVRVLRTHASTP